MRVPHFAWLAGLTLLVAPATGRADVKLPTFFGDNMVLQAGQPLPVWGTAAPGEAVEVRITVSQVPEGQPAAADTVTQSERTTADDNGHWRVTLKPLPSTDQTVGFTVTGKNKVSLENVITGDVWICSGQSNMVWEVDQANNAEEEIAKANFPEIRLFEVAQTTAAEPASDVRGEWKVCSPESVGSFSAVGYYFGRTVHNATSRPVGLIQTAWGGTPAEAWTSQEKLESDKTFQPLLERWNRSDEQAAAKQDGKKGTNDPHHPAVLYNGMLAPLMPLAIKGAIWYQGESNAGRAYQYRTLFPAMITDWRERWGQGDFPFLFVQLANFKARQNQPGESDWAELREAQNMTLALPRTGQAVAIDVGEAKDIHPKNKQDVGARLALAALKIAYGEDVLYSGPTFKDLKIRDGKAVLTFDHVGDGLQARGNELKGFAIAGKDKQFRWADARIDGNKVIVSSDEVSNPVAVRYGWADNPEATLVNSDDLPASPFRTDDWPGVTVNNN